MKNVLRSHYLLWFGSLSGVLPYTSIFAKEHVGASPSEIGLLYTLLPFVALFTKPLICGFTDRFNGHKLMLVIVMIATLTGFGSLILTPWFHGGKWCWWYFCACVMIGNTAMGVGTTLTDSIAMKEVTNRVGTSYGSIRLWGTVGWGTFGLIAGGINDNLFKGLPYLLPGLIMFILIISINIIVITVRFKREALKTQDPKLRAELGTCNREQIQQDGMKCSQSNVISLKGKEDEPTNVTAHEDMESNLKTNGEPLTGGSDFNGKRKVVMKKGKEKKRKSVAKGILRTFLQNPSLFHYCFIIFVVGFLSAFHWSFFFWFIEEIRGKDTLLMGLALVVQSFLGEIPFFLISEKILKKIGPSHCLTLTLVAFAIRFLTYGYLINSDNAYFVLVVELTQGPTFSLFYVVMTQLAQEYSIKSTPLCSPSLSNPSLNSDPSHPSSLVPRSPSFDPTNFESADQITYNARNGDPAIFVTPGLTFKAEESVLEQVEGEEKRGENEDEVYASMQGLMSGLYEGAGLGVGSLMAGILIERFSIVTTWQLAGFIALIIAALNILLDFNIEKCK